MRVFYADPAPIPHGSKGRPRRHGARFVCRDPSSWSTPTAEHRCDDKDYGGVRVRAWAGLHPKLQKRFVGEAYDDHHPPIVRGTVALVEVERLPPGTGRPKQLWLWWDGEGEPDLGLLWRSYCRRFSLEHTFRFVKERLGWTTLRVRHPEQADLWTWLVLVAYAQLRLARRVVEDRRLPWERRYPKGRLTPLRVLRGFSPLLASLGTPAEPAKPCGRSTGRPKERRLSGAAKRHPALRKTVLASRRGAAPAGPYRRRVRRHA